LTEKTTAWESGPCPLLSSFFRPDPKTEGKILRASEMAQRVTPCAQSSSLLQELKVMAGLFVKSGENPLPLGFYILNGSIAAHSPFFAVFLYVAIKPVLC